MREWGHVKHSRKAYAEDPWWLEPRVFSKWEAWEDCIQMAAWKPRRYSIGDAVEPLERGEFVASLRYLAQHWKWDKMTVARWLKVAEKCGRLQRQRECRGGTVYLLVNYDYYQGTPAALEMPERQQVRQQRDSSETPERRQRDKTEAVKASKAGQQNGARDTLADEPPLEWIDE